MGKCLCWDKEVYAPCDGKVIECKDGFKERRVVHLLRHLSVVVKNALTFDPKKGLQTVVGNYLVMECGNNLYAFFAHFRKDSIGVSVGENVRKGQLIGKVGHSGNSTAPHLHFHLMDNSDLMKAKGIPCAFQEYEVFQENSWVPVANGIPTATERFRYLK